VQIRTTLFVAVSVLALGATSCSVDDDSTTAVSTSVTTEETATTSTSVSPPPACEGADDEPTGSDTSIQDILDANGVTDQMVCDLGEVTDEAGYGLDNRNTNFEERQGFAAVVIDTCTEVAAGFQTWDEVIDADVATGAPFSDSQRLNGYLREVFCPALTADSAVDQRVPGPAEENAARGLGSTVDWYPSRYETLPESECVARFGTWISPFFGFQFDADTVMCTREPYRDNVVDPTNWVGLALSSPVDEDAAVATALAVLPEDTRIVDRLIGTNSDPSSSNTCVSIDAQSVSLGEITGDDGYVSILLYPDRQTDLGSSDVYGGTAQQVIVSTGRGNEDSDPVC
jgi:hypothetical protein